MCVSVRWLQCKAIPAYGLMMSVCPSVHPSVNIWLTFAFKFWNLLCNPAIPSSAVSCLGRQRLLYLAGHTCIPWNATILVNSCLTSKYYIFLSIWSSVCTWVSLPCFWLFFNMGKDIMMKIGKYLYQVNLPIQFHNIGPLWDKNELLR